MSIAGTSALLKNTLQMENVWKKEKKNVPYPL